MALSTKDAILITQPLLNSIPYHLLHHYDPAFIEKYNLYSAGRLATHQVPIKLYRSNPSAYNIQYGRQIVDQGDTIITEEQCPVSNKSSSITVRIFQPGPSWDEREARGVYVNFHGGGWFSGGLDTDFDFCKRLVHELGIVVFDVDYRLSPEWKFPVPIEDCWEAFNWIRDEKAKELNLDLNRVAIGGCSAGGHITAVVAHLCRDAGIPLTLQLLAVPVLDLHIFDRHGNLLPDQPYASYRSFALNQPLPLERMTYIHNQFLDPSSLSKPLDWRISPIRAPRFKGLASTLLFTAEIDVLRDVGEAYFKKLKNAGVDTKHVRLKGTYHTFMQHDDFLESGKEYNQIVVGRLRDAFAKGVEDLDSWVLV